jgi:hypothetical protein
MTFTATCRCQLVLNRGRNEKSSNNLSHASSRPFSRPDISEHTVGKVTCLSLPDLTGQIQEGGRWHFCASNCNILPVLYSVLESSTEFLQSYWLTECWWRVTPIPRGGNFLFGHEMKVSSSRAKGRNQFLTGGFPAIISEFRRSIRFRWVNDCV